MQIKKTRSLFRQINLYITLALSFILKACNEYKNLINSHIENMRLEKSDKVDADGKIVAADGKILAADGKIVAADGKIVAADGKILAADGKIVAAQEKSFNQKLISLLPDTKAYSIQMKIKKFDEQQSEKYFEYLENFKSLANFKAELQEGGVFNKIIDKNFEITQIMEINKILKILGVDDEKSIEILKKLFFYNEQTYEKKYIEKNVNKFLEFLQKFQSNIHLANPEKLNIVDLATKDLEVINKKDSYSSNDREELLDNYWEKLIKRSNYKKKDIDIFFEALAKTNKQTSIKEFYKKVEEYPENLSPKIYLNNKGEEMDADTYNKIESLKDNFTEWKKCKDVFYHYEDTQGELTNLSTEINVYGITHFATITKHLNGLDPSFYTKDYLE